MSEPTSAHSVYDLILLVAKAAKIAYYGSDAQQEAMVPVNFHDFDRCLKVVNNGIKQFISDAPADGWKWQEQDAQITFGIVEIAGTVDSGSSVSLIDETLYSTYDTDDDLNGYYVYDTTKKIQAVITDYEIRNGPAVCTDGTGKITVADTGHGLATGDVVLVAGTTDYNGYKEVTYVDANNFTFAGTYTSAQTGTWTQRQVTVAAWLDYFGNASSLTPAAGDSFSITDVETAEGDKSRYILPDNFGEVAGEIEYQRQSGVGHITWTDPTEIRRAYAVSTALGNPFKAAVKSFRRRLWELRLYPSPTAAKTVEFPYRIGFDGLKALSGTASGGSDTTLVDSSFANVYPDDYFNGQFIETLDGTGKNGYAVVTDFAGDTCTFTVADWLSASDESTAAATDPTADTSYFVTDRIKHPAGQMFDVAIKSAIIAEAAEEFGPLQYNAVGKYLEVDLPRAHALDARMRPRKTGVMKSGSPGGGFRGRHHPRGNRSWMTVTYN